MNGQNLESAGFFDSVEHYMSAAGIALLKITADGIIESATENIKDLINYSHAELVKQTIYSYLHPGDHAKLNPTLSNMSFGWDQQEDGQASNRRPTKTRIRMLVKNPEGANDSMEQKQQHQDKYEEVVLFAAPFSKGEAIESLGSIFFLLVH